MQIIIFATMIIGCALITSLCFVKMKFGNLFVPSNAEISLPS